MTNATLYSLLGGIMIVTAVIVFLSEKLKEKKLKFEKEMANDSLKHIKHHTKGIVYENEHEDCEILERDKKLYEFIKLAKSKGHSNETLIEKLPQTGWDEKHVKRVLSRYFKEEKKEK